MVMVTKILVVDDEEEMRDLLSEFLTREGYQVLLAASGDESLKIAQRDNPSVILLDVKMPGLNGIDTCRGLKSHEKTWHIPVIVTTAYRERVLEAFDAGADDFVSKPFHLEELAVRVKSIVRLLHLTDELERAAAYIGELQRNLPHF
jgi:two-component system alkaline phosphatase synthesis response regulator PhoP